MLCCINWIENIGAATEFTAIGASTANFGQTRGFGCYFDFLAGKASLEIFGMYFIAFTDLENIEIDTMIAVIGACTADIWTIT